jgi:hypothetical protein
MMNFNYWACAAIGFGVLTLPLLAWSLAVAAKRGDRDTEE